MIPMVVPTIDPAVLRSLRTKTQAEVDAAAAEHDARDLRPADRRTYSEGSES